MNPFFFFWFVLILIVLSSLRKKRKARELEEAWNTAGRQLRLEYTHAEGSPKRSLHGQYRGFDVRVNTFTQKSKNSSSVMTRYRVQFPHLGLGLELKKQHFLATIGRALSGGKDITVGDDIFDDAVIVGATSPDEAIAFLTPSRRKWILALFTSQRRASVLDNETSFITPGAVREVEVIQRHLESLVNLAAALTDSSDQSWGAPATPAPAEPEYASIEQTFQEEREAAAMAPTPAQLAPDPVTYEQPAPEQREAPGTIEPIDHTASRQDLLSALQEKPASPEASPQELQAAPSDDVDYAALRHALFETDMMSFKAKELFEENYAGRRPRWQGTLKRVSSYSSDLVFKGGPGAKLTIELEPIPDKSYSQNVTATVQIQKDGEAAAKARIGEIVEFTGELIACNGFMRDLSLADGRLLS